jgi:molecular chaperone GrpE
MTHKKNSPKTDENKSSDGKKHIKELQLLLEKKEEELLRCMADLQNVRRRSEQERLRLPQIGSEKILSSLLPSLDHLELALQNMPEKKDDWAKGVESIFSSLLSALESEGLEKIDTSGVPVDPEKHEVLSVDENAKPGEVGEVFQAGYMFKGNVLRAAKVRAGRH